MSTIINLDFLTLRYRFYDLLDAWRREKVIKYHGSTPHHLAELLGFRNIDYLMDDGNTDEVMHTLKLLNGPHGLTIYKMLIARQDEFES